MCGIFGYIGKQTNAADIVLTGLKTLEYRGYDSWGIAVVPSGITVKRITVKKRVGKIGNANVDDMPKSSLAFGHTRWATHGGVTEANAHPHLDCTGTIAVIHNGIIENYETLKQHLEVLSKRSGKIQPFDLSQGKCLALKENHVFQSETDSEVAAHMIEEKLTNNSFTDSVRKTFLAFTGSNALVAIKHDERIIIAIRNGSPLVLGKGTQEYMVASDAGALLPYTKTVYFMEDHDMAVLTDNGITVYEARTGKEKTILYQTLTWDKHAAEKGSYESFMLKEIYEEPDIIKQITNHNDQISNKSQIQNIKNNTLYTLAEKIKSSHGTYLIGCGTASYACMAGTYLFSSIAKRHINAAVASEFSYYEEFLNKKSLVIALSQSGETMDLLDAVKKAKIKKATLAALVNVMGSTLYRMADVPIVTHAGPEIGVASTKDMIAKLSHLILLAYGSIEQWEQGRKTLEKTQQVCIKVLEEKNVNQIKNLAEILKHKEHLFTLGRGLSYPTALEVALKIKEISYIHAEGLAAGELKHGPLALIEKGTPCIMFIPNDETYEANLAAAMEIKARGGYIIGVSWKPHAVFDYYVEVHDCGYGTIIPMIITGQLLAYYLTKARGFDPDKPRNLAKSVTVK